MIYAPCIAGDKCRAFDRNSQTPEDAEDHLLGAACLRAAEFAVRALPRDWFDLEQLLPPGARPQSDRHSTGEHPVPLNVGVEALQRAIWWVVTAWEEVARERDGLSEPVKISRDGPAIQRGVQVLAPRLGMLADHSKVTLMDYPLAEPEEAYRMGPITYTDRMGWQGVLDLIRLHARAVSMLGLTSPVRRLPGSCEECGADDLRQDQPRFHRDEQPVYCGNCAVVMTYDDWRRRMSAWV